MPKRMPVDKAAEAGDHLELLISMRDRIAETVADPNCPPRDLAALTRRLQDIAREIQTIQERRKLENAHDVSASRAKTARGAAAAAWDAAV